MSAWNLDQPLLRLGKNTHVRLRQFLEAIFILGAIGSGKTTGSGKAIIEALLRAGFGGIVCVAKHEEIEHWLGLAAKNGRRNSVIIFDETRGFNFLAHELGRQGMSGLANVVEYLMRLLDMAAHATGSVGRESDAFWLESIKQALNHAIPVLYAAYGSVTVPGILDFITSAATKGDSYMDKEWSEANYAGRTIQRACYQPSVPMPPDTLKAMLDFWVMQWPNIPEKTRGNIIISLSSKLDRFKHGRLHRSFCDKTDIVPEMTFAGAIIILAMPALTWNDDGIIAQQLFKYSWQRAVEMRNSLAPVHRERPVFCYADECQYVANTYDDSFLSTSRSSRATLIYLTQTLPALYARFGKDKADAAKGLVGKFGTQVFHLNSCVETNTYASQLIGRGMQLRGTRGGSTGTSTSRGMNQGTNTNRGTSKNSGASYGINSSGWNHGDGSSSGSGENYGGNVGQGENEGRSWSASEQMDNIVEPNFFATSLKSGGPANGNIVSALWFKSGGSFGPNGSNAVIARFRQ